MGLWLFKMLPESESQSEVSQSCGLFATPWTAAYQAPPSMGFSRQEYWSGAIVFLFLTSLSIIISRFIHIAANGIISFYPMGVYRYTLYICIQCIYGPHLLYPFLC